MYDALPTHPLIRLPGVTETPLALEAVTRDPFIDGLDDSTPSEPAAWISSRSTGAAASHAC